MKDHHSRSADAPRTRGLIAQSAYPVEPAGTHPGGRRRAALRALVAMASLPLIGACQSAYYAAMEKIGYEKRDILASRVEAARDAQQDAKKEVVDALTAFSETVNFKGGGELEARYKSLASHLADSEAAANDVRQRVQAVSDVGEALFSEWQDELEQYRSAALKARSREQMRSTRKRYDKMLAAMQRAETRIEPALATLRDQVLFLKHNLNARALGSMQGEVDRVDAQVRQLIAEINKAVAEADGFIATLEEPPAASRDQ
ncbi:MAG: DUF2959 domain-containing protein [Burkholderiaceae bacterium]